MPCTISDMLSRPLFPVELIVWEPSGSNAVVSVPDGVKQVGAYGLHTV